MIKGTERVSCLDLARCEGDSLCHVAQSRFNPRCVSTAVGHVVVRLTGMRSHFGGFVITCLLICEYFSRAVCQKWRTWAPGQSSNV